MYLFNKDTRHGAFKKTNQLICNKIQMDTIIIYITLIYVNHDWNHYDIILERYVRHVLGGCGKFSVGLLDLVLFIMKYCNQ